MCDNPTRENIINTMREVEFQKTKTCRVSVFQNAPMTFEKVAANKRVSVNGPSGRVCGDVITTTIEHDEGYESLWTFREVRSTANSEDPLCEGLDVNRPQVYRWNGAADDVTMDCEVISFGF